METRLWCIEDWRQYGHTGRLLVPWCRDQTPVVNCPVAMQHHRSIWLVPGARPVVSYYTYVTLRYALLLLCHVDRLYSCFTNVYMYTSVLHVCNIMFVYACMYIRISFLVWFRSVTWRCLSHVTNDKYLSLNIAITPHINNLSKSLHKYIRGICFTVKYFICCSTRILFVFVTNFLIHAFFFHVSYIWILNSSIFVIPRSTIVIFCCNIFPGLIWFSFLL